MKTMLFILTTFLAVGASAKNPYDVCASMSFSSDKMKCIEIVQGKYYDSAAVDVCDNLSFVSEKLNCLVEIGNKSFDSGALRICGTLPYQSDVINCLKKIERPFISSCPRYSDIKSALDSIQFDLRDGQISEATWVANQLQMMLVNCQDH